MDNVIFKRRSIRRFLDKPVEQEKLERILRAGMQAPSAHNNQRWELLVVTDKDKREALSKMSPWAGMVAKAPVAIVVMGDTSNEELKQWFQQDLSACTENILLQIAEENLGGCWMGFYPNMERVKMIQDYFNIPEQILPFSVIALGYSEDENKYVDRYDANRVHYNKY